MVIKRLNMKVYKYVLSWRKRSGRFASLAFKASIIHGILGLKPTINPLNLGWSLNFKNCHCRQYLRRIVYQRCLTELGKNSLQFYSSPKRLLLTNIFASIQIYTALRRKFDAWKKLLRTVQKISFWSRVLTLAVDKAWFLRLLFFRHSAAENMPVEIAEYASRLLKVSEMWLCE